jgi:hypothetical protein
MDNRERQIRERAFSMWEAEGGIHGRHEDHWYEAEREVDESEPIFSAAGSAEDTAGLNPEAPQAETEEQDVPPARTGKTKTGTSPVEAAGDDNPIHHDGRLPTDPLTK